MCFYLYIFYSVALILVWLLDIFSVSLASLYVCHIFIIFFEYYYKWIKAHLRYSLPWWYKVSFLKENFFLLENETRNQVLDIGSHHCYWDMSASRLSQWTEPGDLRTLYSSVQLLSHVQLFETLRIAAHQAFLSITNSWSLLKLMSIESVMPSTHLILCRPLLLPSVFPSIRGFSNESVLHIM